VRIYRNYGTLPIRTLSEQMELRSGDRDLPQYIVSEVKGLRSDLKGRMEERLQRIESDVEEIKARMKP
jgi:hypothetical protein